jgi:hypothetical protein
MANGWPVSSARTRETRMLGVVPTKVTRPPTSEPKAIGISSADVGVPPRRATCTAIGRKMARAPTFFMKAERTVTPAVRAATRVPVVRSRGSRRRIARPIVPDLPTAALSTSAEATMTTTWSPKPAKAAPGGTTPAAIAVSRASSATRS